MEWLRCWFCVLLDWSVATSTIQCTSGAQIHPQKSYYKQFISLEWGTHWNCIIMFLLRFTNFAYISENLSLCVCMCVCVVFKVQWKCKLEEDSLLNVEEKFVPQLHTFGKAGRCTVHLCVGAITRCKVSEEDLHQGLSSTPWHWIFRVMLILML